MRNLKRVMAAAMAIATVGACVTGCQSTSTQSTAGTQTTAAAAKEDTKAEPTAAKADDKSSDKYVDTITMVWYPNESAEDYDVARTEFSTLIEQATGKKVEHQLTTDYAVAIEAMASGKAQICFFGAEGYVQANAKNNAVQPLFVNSGESGTLDDAIYYSFLAVEEANADEYKDGDTYSIDNIAGKKMSFVSNSSTSGFKVPTQSIISHFSQEEEYRDLDKEALLEGGEFFSEVLFGGSHQGSAFNLMSGKADVAAFCDTEIKPYADCTEGEANQIGSVYTIKADATAPFDTVQGETFTIIQSTPVLNGPFAYNSETLSPDDVKAIQDQFTSDEVTNNEKIFVPADSDGVGVFHKKGDNKIVLVEDSWYDPIRNMGK